MTLPEPNIYLVMVALLATSGDVIIWMYGLISPKPNTYLVMATLLVTSGAVIIWKYGSLDNLIYFTQVVEHLYKLLLVIVQTAELLPRFFDIINKF